MVENQKELEKFASTSLGKQEMAFSWSVEKVSAFQSPRAVSVLFIN